MQIMSTQGLNVAYEYDNANAVHQHVHPSTRASLVCLLMSPPLSSFFRGSSTVPLLTLIATIFLCIDSRATHSAFVDVEELRVSRPSNFPLVLIVLDACHVMLLAVVIRITRSN